MFYTLFTDTNCDDVRRVTLSDWAKRGRRSNPQPTRISDLRGPLSQVRVKVKTTRTAGGHPVFPGGLLALDFLAYEPEPRTGRNEDVISGVRTAYLSSPAGILSFRE